MGPIILVVLFVIVGLAVFISISKNDLGVVTFKNDQIDLKDKNETPQKALKEEETSSQSINDSNLQSNINEANNTSEIPN
tara:strand:+ start:2646 stop:2885 length:240 start_codon:yes stop_codon:yes gene_type:complete